MFQTEQNGGNELQAVIQEELEYFNSVLQFSRKFLRQVKSLPIPVLADMVRYRQEWIDKIQKLEERRKVIDKDLENDATRKLTKEISKLAGQLVKTDEQIYSGLQKRKLNFVKEHADIVSETSYTKKQRYNSGQSANKLDIVQE